MSTLNGKVVAITGASSGIGAATARLLADRGATVVLGARREDRLRDVADEIHDAGGTALTVATNVTQRADAERLVSAAVDEFGHLDVFIGNAGIASIGPTADLDVDGWDAMIDVNLRGVLHGIAAAMPVFGKQGYGDFVTVVSTAGIKIVPGMGVYAATKNAVRTLLEALRQESTDGMIRTTSISPGYVNTELDSSIEDPEARRQARAEMERMGLAPEAVARAIAFAVEQPRDVEIGDITIRPTIQG